MQGAGYLAIWSDLTPQDETDWAHWITREHAAERVGVNGFLACRIFRALGVSVNRYFILYELEDERVVGGPDYLARLNAPTPWSQRIMPRLGNFARGGGRIAASAGTGQGGIVAPLRLDAAPSWDAASARRRVGAARPHHRRAGPAHRHRADLDQDPRKGHASQRRLLRRFAADRGTGRSRGPRRPPSSAQDAPCRGSRRDRRSAALPASPSACRSDCCRADDTARSPEDLRHVGR